MNIYCGSYPPRSSRIVDLISTSSLSSICSSSMAISLNQNVLGDFILKFKDVVALKSQGNTPPNCVCTARIPLRAASGAQFALLQEPVNCVISVTSELMG